MSTLGRRPTAVATGWYDTPRKADGASPQALDNIIPTAAEGYALPTNLDLDQSVGSLAPQSQADLVRQALAENWESERLSGALDAQQDRRHSKVG